LGFDVGVNKEHNQKNDPNEDVSENKMTKK
jgi:hypothetical protein